MEPENYDQKKSLFLRSTCSASMVRFPEICNFDSGFQGFCPHFVTFPNHGMISNWHKNPPGWHIFHWEDVTAPLRRWGLMGRRNQWKAMINSDVSTKMRMFLPRWGCLYQDEDVFSCFFLLYNIQGTWLPLIVMINDRRCVVSIPDNWNTMEQLCWLYT